MIEDAAALQQDAAVQWQAARHRVLRRCELHCEQCGAEHQRLIWKHLYDRRSWWPVIPGTPAPRRDLHVVDVRLVVVPVTPPWDGTDASLLAICMGCWIWRAIEQLRAATPRPAQPTLWGTP